MLFKTHLAFSFLIGLYLIDIFKVENKVLFITVLLFFSVFPDIDERSSKVGKKLRPLSHFARLFGHRTIFHTIYFPLLILLILSLFGFLTVGIAALVGYSLHLFLDSITKQGVAWFYPLSKKRIAGLIKVGSLFENFLFFIIVILIILHLFSIL